MGQRARVLKWDDPLPSDVLNADRALSARNTKAPADLFCPPGNTVTYQEYYECRDRAHGSSPVPLAEIPTSPKEPPTITTSIRDGV